jgi:Protein of unknown function (DUF3618)
MTDTTRTMLDGHSVADPATAYDRQPVPDDPAALHADIDDARTRLSETVDEIHHRLDVKARTKDAARGVGYRAKALGRRATAVGRRRSVAIAGSGVAIAGAAGAGILAWRRWRR